MNQKIHQFDHHSDLKRVPNERILLAETKEMHRIVETKLTAFQSAQETGAELVDQAVTKLEKVGDRLSEIRKELQTAIRDKIDLSKSKMKELQLEVHAMIEEVESFGKLANV